MPESEDVWHVIRPDDLVELEVTFRGTKVERNDLARPAYAIAHEPGARMIVRFAFQHAHEQAQYETTYGAGKDWVPDETNPTGPPSRPAKGADPELDPPVGFAPARRSRLVFDIPLNDGVRLDTTGILQAMSERALVVAPNAVPEAPEADSPVVAELLVNVDVKAVLREDRVTLVPTTATERRQARALDRGRVNEIRAVLRRELATKFLDIPAPTRGFLDHVEELDIRRRPPFVPPIVPPLPGRVNKYSKAPEEDETAIEAPYRLIISPNAWGGWAHALAPEPSGTDSGHVELWHTRLGYAVTSGVVEERNPDSRRIVRALWARDRDAVGDEWRSPGADAPGSPLGTPQTAEDLPFKGSLNRADRHRLVRQTAETWSRVAPQPVRADRLHLSALGAWLDLHGQWQTQQYTAAGIRIPSILKWDHVAPQGRDQFVRVMYPGYLYPFGHRAVLVKITERKIRPRLRPHARLFQRMFLVLTETTRTYDTADFPFTSVTLSPVVTPDIDDPGEAPDKWFWPLVGNQPFPYVVSAIDKRQQPIKTRAPLIWVNEAFGVGDDGVGDDVELEGLDDAYAKSAHRELDLGGQPVNYVPHGVAGDARVVTSRIRLLGQAVPATSTPRLGTADVVLPAAQRLTGLGELPIVYEKHYRAGTQDTTVGAWAGVVTAETSWDTDYARYLRTSTKDGWLAPDPVVAVPTVEFGPSPVTPGAPPPAGRSDVGSDRGGGFLQPSLPIRLLTTNQGPVGDLAQATSATFDPTEALKGAMPRLFGLFSLATLIVGEKPEDMPSIASESVDAVGQLLDDMDSIRRIAVEIAGQTSGAASLAAAEAADALATLRSASGTLASRIAREGDPATVIDEVLAGYRGARNKLREALSAATPLERNRSAALDTAIESALADVASFARIARAVDGGLANPGEDLRVRFTWTPRLRDAWPGDDPVIRFNDRIFRLDVDGRVPASGGAPQFEVLAELRDFEFDLVPGAPLLKVPFEHISFRSGAAGKTEVDVVLRKLTFQGALAFVEDIKDLIPLDGFSDPPFMDVTPAGIRAGFSLGLPNLALGVFSLSNISLGADVRVPFLGEIVTVGFSFCTREKPFVLTICFLGGGGFFALRLSPERVEILELSLEAGAYLSVDFGVASGSISAAIGVYMKMEGDDALIRGFFRLRGEVDVLGLISAAIELAMSLDYYPRTGKVIGRASITVEVEVLVFSGRVVIEAERQFAGTNGDPSFRDAYLADDNSAPGWTEYLDCFAPEEVTA